ncbi:MAG: sodium-translocating pyrophosphatase [Thaumarchaeota archaeon]|nr:sodium-translocating pyrophosphatase [Nitrososphaerota archaeon]
MELLAPVSGVIALVVALYLALWINRFEPGTERMKEIYEAIRVGSKAYLRRQYKTISVIAVILTLLLYAAFDFGPHGGVPFISLAFLVGALFSLAAGYVGMDVSTRANARTTYAMHQGVQLPMKIAYNGGLVMGLFNVGLSLLAVSVLFYAYGQKPELIVGLGFGASLAALFAQLGGGIFTKAADVGADIVGKVEAGIPEDDPRNPAVIADNVGDNVGDVAGRGADLFESMTAENIGAMIVGVALVAATGNPFFVLFPLLARAVGIFGTIIGLPFVRAKNFTNPMVPMRNGIIATTIIIVIGLYALVSITIQSINLYFAAIVGVGASLLIFLITQYYTEKGYRPVEEIATASKTGPAVNIITGFAVGLESTGLPVLVIVGAILGGFYFGNNFAAEAPALFGGATIDPLIGGIYGTAVATMGMLSVAGVILGMDGFGPIVDNAAGIAEMSKAPKELREKIDLFDAAGNTTKALTKGYALGSAGLAALLLFQAYLDEYAKAAGLTVLEAISVRIVSPEVIAALFIGGLVPYVFSAFAIRAVGKAAFQVVEEVRRQFKEIPGLMEGKANPDYSKCVDISTLAAQKQMILPGIMPVVVPLIVGFTLGPVAVGAFLISATISGTMLAYLMNTGGASWDNAKKYIETGVYGGKRSEAHMAAVVGDTVGDPFKDTAGPSLHVLVKLINTVSLTFVPLFVLYALL